MKKSAILHKLLDYIFIANHKIMHSISILFEDQIKKAEFILQSSERKEISTDLAKISWGNYMTQEEMQKIFKGNSKNKKLVV